MSMSLKARAASLGRHVELLIFPSFCRLCSTPLGGAGERVVCRECLGSLVSRRGPICLCCGRFIEGAGEDHVCAKCLDRAPAFARHRSCGRYGGVLKDLILLFKYGRVSVLSPVLARYAAESLGGDEGVWEGLDYIVPVPLHRKRRRERGFNQSQLLARDLARIQGFPVLERCLVKVRNVPPQTSLEGAGREGNVRGAYAAKGTRKIAGKTLLLVDDVFTTGSTLRECSRILLSAGAREIRALTLAQA